jgi:choline transport protein
MEDNITGKFRTELPSIFLRLVLLIGQRVSEFAPRKYQKFLSYTSGAFTLIHYGPTLNLILAGWFSLLSWQAGTAGVCYVIGNIIQSLLISYSSTYVPFRWQGTLFVVAVALAQAILNTAFASQLPRMQNIMVIPHALGWIAVVIVLWVMAPHATARDVFLNFTSNEGWEPIGLSLMVGQISSVSFLKCKKEIHKTLATYLLLSQCLIRPHI